jgi:hypothetical protein
MAEFPMVLTQIPMYNKREVGLSVLEISHLYFGNGSLFTMLDV